MILNNVISPTSFSRARTSAASIVLVLFAAGCAGAETSEARQIAQLQDSITGIQNDNERFAQALTTQDAPLSDKEAARVAQGKMRAAEEEAARSPAMATPRVVQVGAPSESEESEAQASDDPDDATPRPSIHVSGYATRISRNSKNARNQGASDRVEESNVDDQVAPAADAASAAPGLALRGNGARASALDPEAKPAYDAALSLINHKQYAQALDAFAAFLVRWPDHPNADNAMYWRGEAYFAQGDIAHANEQFEGLVARFPMGNKVPDALLKLGVCQERLGNSQKAKAYYEQLAREYPRSEARRKIPSEGSASKREDKK